MQHVLVREGAAPGGWAGPGSTRQARPQAARPSTHTLAAPLACLRLLRCQAPALHPQRAPCPPLRKCLPAASRYHFLRSFGDVLVSRHARLYNTDVCTSKQQSHYEAGCSPLPSASAPAPCTPSQLPRPLPACHMPEASAALSSPSRREEVLLTNRCFPLPCSLLPLGPPPQAVLVRNLQCASLVRPPRPAASRAPPDAAAAGDAVAEPRRGWARRGQRAAGQEAGQSQRSMQGPASPVQHRRFPSVTRLPPPPGRQWRQRDPQRRQQSAVLPDSCTALRARKRP